MDWKAMKQDAGLGEALGGRTIGQLQDRASTLRSMRDKLVEDLVRMPDAEVLGSGEEMMAKEGSAWRLSDGAEALREADVAELDFDFLQRVRQRLDEVLGLKSTIMSFVSVTVPSGHSTLNGIQVAVPACEPSIDSTHPQDGHGVCRERGAQGVPTSEVREVGCERSDGPTTTVGEGPCAGRVSCPRQVAARASLWTGTADGAEAAEASPSSQQGGGEDACVGSLTAGLAAVSLGGGPSSGATAKGAEKPAYRKWTATETAALQTGLRRYRRGEGKVDWKAMKQDAGLGEALGGRTIGQLQDRASTLRSMRDKLAKDLEGMAGEEQVGLGAGLEAKEGSA